MAKRSIIQPFLSTTTEFPIVVLNHEEFKPLLDSFKQKLWLILCDAKSLSNIEVVQTQITKVGNVTLKRIERTVTEPQITIPAIDFDEYTLEDLWSVLTKRGKFRRLRLYMMGRRVKSSFGSKIMVKISKERKLRPIINPEAIAKWLVIRRAVFEKLTDLQKAEWGFLSSLMAASEGGRLLELENSDPKVGEANKGKPPHTAEGLTVDNQSNNQTIFNVPSRAVGSEPLFDYPPERPGRRLSMQTETSPKQAAMNALEQRVAQLELNHQSHQNQEATHRLWELKAHKEESRKKLAIREVQPSSADSPASAKYIGVSVVGKSSQVKAPKAPEFKQAKIPQSPTVIAQKPSGSKIKEATALQFPTVIAPQPSGSKFKGGKAPQTPTLIAPKPPGSKIKEAKAPQSPTVIAPQPSGSKFKEAKAPQSPTVIAPQPSGSKFKEAKAPQTSTLIAPKPSGSKIKEGKAPQSSNGGEPVGLFPWLTEGVPNKCPVRDYSSSDTDYEADFEDEDWNSDRYETRSIAGTTASDRRHEVMSPVSWIAFCD